MDTCGFKACFYPISSENKENTDLEPNVRIVFVLFPLPNSITLYRPKGCRSLITEYLEPLFDDEPSSYAKRIMNSQRGESLMKLVEMRNKCCVWCSRPLNLEFPEECTCTIRKRYPILEPERKHYDLPVPRMKRTVAPIVWSADGIVVEELLMLELTHPRTNAQLVSLPSCNFLTLKTNSMILSLVSRSDLRLPRIPRIPPNFFVHDQSRQYGKVGSLMIFVRYADIKRWDNERFWNCAEMEGFGNEKMTRMWASTKQDERMVPKLFDSALVPILNRLAQYCSFGADRLKRISKVRIELSQHIYYNWQQSQVLNTNCQNAATFCMLDIDNQPSSLDQDHTYCSNHKTLSPLQTPLPNKLCEMLDMWESNPYLQGYVASSCGCSSRILERHFYEKAEGLFNKPNINKQQPLYPPDVKFIKLRATNNS